MSDTICLPRAVLAALVEDDTVYKSATDDYTCYYCRRSLHLATCPVRLAQAMLAETVTSSAQGETAT